MVPIGVAGENYEILGCFQQKFDDLFWGMGSGEGKKVDFGWEASPVVAPLVGFKNYGCARGCGDGVLARGVLTS